MSKVYMMRYLLFMGINKCHFPQFKRGLQNSVTVRNQSKMPLIQEDQGPQLPNQTLVRSSPVLRKMSVRQLTQMTNLALASIHCNLKNKTKKKNKKKKQKKNKQTKKLKVTKISAR